MTNYLFIDGSYFIFFRYFSVLNWYKLSHKGEEINEAKILLANCITELAHGKEKSRNAFNSAKEIMNKRVGITNLPSVNIDLSILKDGNQIAIVNNFKVFINFDKFFSINNIKIKDTIFKKVDFRLNKNDISFFNKQKFIKK